MYMVLFVREKLAGAVEDIFIGVVSPNNNYCKKAQ